MVMRGGSRPGSETKWLELSGWVAVMFSTGGVPPGRATVNAKRTGARPRMRTITLTRSPGERLQRARSSLRGARE